MGWVPYQLSNGRTRVIHISTDKNGDLHYGLQMSYRRWLRYRNKPISLFRLYYNDRTPNKYKRLYHRHIDGYKRFLKDARHSGEMLSMWGGRPWTVVGPLTPTQKRALGRKYDRQWRKEQASL